MVGADDRPVNIIQRIGAGQYKDFGMYLLNDENMTKVDNIKTLHIYEGPRGITKAIIIEWLVSDCTPHTHEHLIGCIRKCGLGALAGDIENALSSAGIITQ